jgi:glycosyltransferase involved in cell wall biosynthesis
MRILWLKMGGLWPATAGGRIRSLETLSCLSRRHEVTVLTTHGQDDDPEGLRQRLPACKEIISIPFVAPRVGSKDFLAKMTRSWLSPLPVDLWKWRVDAVRDRARLLAEDTDVCVADFLVSFPNAPKTTAPLILFEHNVEYMIWRRLAALERRPWRRALLELEWRKMRRAERASCTAADLTVAVSEDDRERLEKLAPAAHCTAIRTGVDTAYFSPGDAIETPHHLVFTGSMDWFPNEDAILYFADSILPRIRSQLPEVTLAVVGRNPSARLLAAARRAGIVVTGTVDDVRPFVGEAAVYVVPLRAGGGTRLKIFEALAMGKAVVSTTVGAEGLAVTNGHDIAIADDPDAFATSVAELLRDPARRRTLGRAGRELVESRYSWEHATKDFERYCYDVSARTSKRRVQWSAAQAASRRQVQLMNQSK